MKESSSSIRVLIVDDSPFAREVIRDILADDSGFTVVGEASDGLEAVEMASLLAPDIITMDIEMPVMGGYEAIEKIMNERPVPILVVTALSGAAMAYASISKGALDVIEKPDISMEVGRNLLNKLKLLSKVDVSASRAGLSERSGDAIRSDLTTQPQKSDSRIVAIAASTGGPQAIYAIISSLPATFPAPILITQHMTEGFTDGLVDWLSASTPLKVSIARDGDCVTVGHVYVNPAEYSMRMTEQGRILLGNKDQDQLYNPSCDTFLNSIAAVYGERAIGLILSGIGDDGVAGIQAIKAAGGSTLAQDEKSSVVFGMNRVAIENNCVDKIVPLADIPAELIQQVCGTK